MATTSVTRKIRNRPLSTASVRELLQQFDAREGALVPVDLLTTAENSMRIYGMASVLRRSLPDYRDGLIPARRRILYAMHEEGNDHTHRMVKSAQPVGNTLSRYHPYGDTAVYGSVQQMVNGSTPLLEGIGNWGTQMSGAAHYRLTSVRLAKFADEAFFSERYMPLVPMVPNYDGTRQEPLYLPALLPTLLINGLEGGVAVGVQSFVPGCTKDSVKQVVEAWMSGQEITPKYLFETLKFNLDRFGCELFVPDQESMDSLVAFYQTGSGKALLIPKYEVDRNNHTISILGHAPLISPATVMEMIREDHKRFSWVLDIHDRTDKNTAGPMRMDFVFRRPDTAEQFQVWCNRIVNQFSWRMSLGLNLVERSVDEHGNEAARFRRFTLMEFINAWCEWRVQLERDALERERTLLQQEANTLALRMAVARDPAAFMKALSAPDEKAALCELYGINTKQAEWLLGQRLQTIASSGVASYHGKLARVHQRLALNRVDNEDPRARICREMQDL